MCTIFAELKEAHINVIFTQCPNLYVLVDHQV
jgi:hypothetical protein